MDRGNRYGAMGTRGGYSPTRKKNDGNRRPNNFQRSANDGKDERSEYLERYLGKFTSSLNKGIGGDNSSTMIDPRESKFVPRSEQRNKGLHGRDSRGGGEGSIWKSQASSYSGGNNQAQRPSHDKRTPFNYSSSKPHSNIHRQNPQRDFSTPTMVPPPSHTSAAGKMPSLQMSGFNKTFSLWQSESEQKTQSNEFITNIQAPKITPSGTSQSLSSSNPMPVPAPSLNLLSGGSSDRNYSNLQSHLSSFLPLHTGSNQSGSTQIPDSNAARSFNASVPPPSVALPAMASLGLPAEMGKSVPDGSRLWTYPAPELNSLTFDPATGLRFDAITGLHYDANSGYFYNYKLGLYLVYDVLKQTYIRAPVHAAGLGEQPIPSMIQPAGAPVPQPLMAQTQISTATSIATQESQRQSVTDLQNIMAVQQWNPQITPSSNNLALRVENAMKMDQQLESDGMSDDEIDSSRQNQNAGCSRSGNPRRNLTNQRQDRRQNFNESANRNQNYGRKPNALKRSRSRSTEGRQYMHERSKRVYQETQPRNPAEVQNRERFSNYSGRPTMIEPTASSGSESRNKYNRDSSGRRSPASDRVVSGQREDHLSSSDPRYSRGYNPHRTNLGSDAPQHKMKSQRSPVNRHKVENRSTRLQNYDGDRCIEDHRAHSSRQTDSSQERAFPDRRRQLNRSPSLERPQSRGSRKPRRDCSEDSMIPHKIQDKKYDMVQEHVIECRRTPGIENQASKNLKTLNVGSLKHMSASRAKSPDNNFRQKGRGDEKTFDNDPPAWSSRQGRTPSPLRAQIKTSRNSSRERDSTRISSPDYCSKPGVSRIRDIDDYSNDVSALLLDQSSEVSMERGNDGAYDQGESKSKQRNYSRTQKADDDVGRHLSRSIARRSNSQNRSLESHGALSQRRSRSRGATQTRRRVSKSPTFPSTRRRGSRLRSVHRESESRARSPPPRADSQRGLHGSRTAGNSHRQNAVRDQKSPLGGRDVRQSWPSKRSFRSPLSRLGEVRQNVDRSSFDGKHIKRGSTSTDRSDSRLHDREKRNSPIRNVNNRHSPQGRRSPCDDRSSRRDVSTRKRSPRRSRSLSNVRSETHAAPASKPCQSPPDRRRYREEFSPSSSIERSQSPRTEPLMPPAGSPKWVPDGGSPRFDQNDSPSRAQSEEESYFRLAEMSPNGEEFAETRPASRNSEDENGSGVKRSDDINSCNPDTHKPSGESAKKNFEEDRCSRSRTPQKLNSRRSASPEVKRKKLDVTRRNSESLDESNVIDLGSDDELGLGIEDVPMTSEDCAIDDEEQLMKPSQSVGNLSINSDELNYSASSMGSEPFDEEDESWTVLDCVEGESEKEFNDDKMSGKDDDYGRENERSSSSRLIDYKSGKNRPQPSRKQDSRNDSRPVKDYAQAYNEESRGLCKPLKNDKHALARYFEPNPTRFIAATYRLRNLQFKFIKNFLLQKLGDLQDDVKVIPCKRDVNAAPYDFVTMIFPNSELAAEWRSRYHGKLVSQFKRQTLEIFLYFHLGNWTCENCEAINFPLRSICYSCFNHKDGGFSPLKMLNSPSRFIAIYKLSNMHPKQAIEPFNKLFKRNPYKRLHTIRDPRTNYFSGVIVIEMPNRLKGQSLFKWLPIEYKNESRCAYVKMVDPHRDDEIGDVRRPAPSRKSYSPSKMPFQHFKNLTERAQLPKHRVPKPDGRGLLMYRPPDKKQFTFEPITQMYYDSFTGLYFHPQSNLFYNDELHICLRWDDKRNSYLYIDTTEEE